MGDCRNYCFNRTTLSQARRNKPEIILTGWEKEGYEKEVRGERKMKGVERKTGRVRGQGMRRGGQRVLSARAARVEARRLSRSAAQNYHKGM